jgi:hypothetical protein
MKESAPEGHPSIVFFISGEKAPSKVIQGFSLGLKTEGKERAQFPQ